MLHPELEKLVREAWEMVAAEMGVKFLELSWIKGPTRELVPLVQDEELPLAA